MCACARKPANSDKLIVMQSRSTPRARNVMTRDDDLRIRLGRIRSRGSRSAAVHRPGPRSGGEGRRLGASIANSTSWQVRTWPGRESLCLTPDRSLTSSGGKGPRSAAPGEPGSAQCSSELPAARGRNQRRGLRSYVRCRSAMTSDHRAFAERCEATGIISGSSYRRTTRPSCPTSKP